jgi:hypothetical protein
MFKKVRVAVLAILTCWIFVSVPPAVSQIDDVQAAIAQKDHLGALRILSAISDEASTPDTYLYLGIAYANLRLCKRALGAFREGFNRYPTDPRFHSEGVAFYRRISLGSGPSARGRATTLFCSAAGTALCSGRVLLNARFRPMDGKFKSQIRIDSLLARASLLGDLNCPSKTTSCSVSIARPFDPLRPCRRGSRPLWPRPDGHRFVLVNSSIERPVAALPVLNNVPILSELFFDSAKLSDRNHIFQQRGWLFDAGMIVRTQLPDFDFVVLYGRNLSEGKGVLTAYVQHRFW